PQLFYGYSVPTRRSSDLSALTGLLLAEAVDDGQPPVAAEGARRDLDPDRPLPALVLGGVDHAHDLADGRRIEALGDQIGHAAALDRKSTRLNSSHGSISY